MAVLGLGPAGMRAVERLVHWGRRLPAGPVRIDCFEAAGPGGPGFDPALPDFLRSDAAALDAWHREGAAPAGDALPTFEQWRPGFDRAFDRSPARGLIGRYFEAAWADLHRLLPEGWELRHVVAGVDDLTRDAAGRWGVRDEAYDEVLVTELGGAQHADALAAHWTGGLPLVGVRSGPGGDAEVPPGCAVAIRGVGPAFLDAALAVTEGRGGRFAPGRRAHRMTYRRSGSDVAVIYPFAVARRFPDVRPSPDHVPSVLAAAHRPVPLFTEVASVVHALLDAAAEELVAAGVAPLEEAADLASAALARLEAGVAPPIDPREQLEVSLRIAFGEQPIAPETALGMAWRWVCPALHDLVRDDALPAADRERLVHLADALAPVAAGPAPVNGVKLLALIEAGVVDPRSLSWAGLDAAGVDWPASAPMPRPSIDVVVDAADAPAGFEGFDGGLTVPLRAAGVRSGAGRRGVAIGPDAVCADLPGLACAGAPTKDLTPCEHARGSGRLLDRWAEGVLTRAAAVQSVNRSRYPSGSATTKDERV